jgi:hypothetical protein
LVFNANFSNISALSWCAIIEIKRKEFIINNHNNNFGVY